jgi:hypothetical protein
MRRFTLLAWLLAALLAVWVSRPIVRAEEDTSAAAQASPASRDDAAVRGGDAARGERNDAADPLAFVRFSDDGKGGGTLDTAIASYANADGVVVHLVAAVHVGEKAYYAGLAETFETYDALLYELVKPKDGPVPGARPVPGAKPPGAGAQVRGAAVIGGFQSMLKDVLELQSQLESINYDRPNFVHADLDAETFNEMQAQRGESLFRLMLRSMMHEMSRQRKADGKGGGGQVSLFELLAAMSSPDSARQYKLLLARQMKDMDAQLEAIEGPDGSVIIAERNKAALRVLERTIGEGKRNVGVFYGAGHMRGIEEALTGGMGFTRTGVQWRVAWDMRAGDGQKGVGREVREAPAAEGE